MPHHLKYKGEEIDARLDLAGTALQKHQDISHLAIKQEVDEQLSEKVDKESGKGLSTEDFTSEEKKKLASLQNYDDSSLRSSVVKLQDEVAKKEDNIRDLEQIRTGAKLGLTSIQEHQNIEHLATKESLGEESKRIDSLSKSVTNIKRQVEVLVSDGDGSVIDTVGKEVAKIVADAPDALDNLKKIADFITADATQAAELATTVGKHEKKINCLEEKFYEIHIMSEREYDKLDEKNSSFIYMLFEE